MASKIATTLASSPPKPSTVAPTSVWSLLGEQGFETSAFSSFFEPSVAEGKESIELPKGCGAHLLYGVAPHELSTAVQAYSELLSLKLAYHQPEEEEPSRRANTELGRLLRYHGDVKGLAALTDDSEFALAAYFDLDGQEDFVSHGDNALASDLQNVRALTQDLLQHVTPPSRDFLGGRLLEVYMVGFLQPIDVLALQAFASANTKRHLRAKERGDELLASLFGGFTDSHQDLKCVTITHKRGYAANKPTFDCCERQRKDGWITCSRHAQGHSWSHMLASIYLEEREFPAAAQPVCAACYSPDDWHQPQTDPNAVDDFAYCICGRAFSAACMAKAQTRLGADLAMKLAENEESISICEICLATSPIAVHIACAHPSLLARGSLSAGLVGNTTGEHRARTAGGDTP
ncbi:hypothetical protein RI054_16g75480 [Pseudoscourfieldia marina]